MPSISYNIIGKFRDCDNYPAEQTYETDYLNADTVEELYTKITELCMKIHKQNFKSRLYKHKYADMIIRNILDFGYCDSYCDDSYIEFGPIILDSIPIDHNLLDNTLLDDFIKDIDFEIKEKQRILDEHNIQMKRKQLKKLKEELGEV